MSDTTSPDPGPELADTRPRLGVSPEQIDQAVATLRTGMGHVVAALTEAAEQIRAVTARYGTPHLDILGSRSFTTPDGTTITPPLNPVPPYPPELPALCRMIEPTTHDVYVPHKGERAVVFLGPVDGAPWHDHAASEFARLWVNNVGDDVPLALIVPRRRDTYYVAGVPHRDGRPLTAAEQRAQTEWEHTNARPSNGIAVFHFPPSRRDRAEDASLIQLGQVWGRIPFVVAAHPAAPSRQVLKQQCTAMEADLFSLLAAALGAGVDKLLLVDPARGIE